jgi:hypothetical protein
MTAHTNCFFEPLKLIKFKDQLCVTQYAPPRGDFELSNKSSLRAGRDAQRQEGPCLQ